MQAFLLEARPDIGNRRLVGDWRVFVGSRVMRFGGIFAQTATDLIHAFSLAVPRLQHLIRKRPGWRYALAVFDDCEILFAITRQHGAVELRIPADIVIVSGIESLAVRLVPGFLRSKMSPLEDRALVAVDRKVGDMIAGFEDQYLRAGRGQAGRDRGAADA